jgi:hypothetical protein
MNTLLNEQGGDFLMDRRHHVFNNFFGPSMRNNDNNNHNHNNNEVAGAFDNQMESSSESHRRQTTRRNRGRQSVAGLNTSTCQQLANIIGGMVIATSPACVVQRNRNINAEILGRRTQSPLALPFALSFENNQGGNTLNLGETVILQEEINPFLSALRKRGITVTALHNHWLFEQPRLMYMHWENVGDPFEFARKSAEAAREVGLF